MFYRLLRFPIYYYWTCFKLFWKQAKENHDSNSVKFVRIQVFPEIQRFLCPYTENTGQRKLVSLHILRSELFNERMLVPDCFSVMVFMFLLLTNFLLLICQTFFAGSWQSTSEFQTKKMPRFPEVQCWIVKVINNNLVTQIQIPSYMNKKIMLQFLNYLYR